MSIIEKIIFLIGKKSSEKAWQTLNRNNKLLNLLKAVDLKPKPDHKFESIYAHALVEFGLEKPGALIQFFGHEDIQKAFQKSFEKKELGHLNCEAEHLISWNKIGDDLRQQHLDPRLEFARFTLVFHEVLSRTRTPFQIRSEGKLDEILKLVKDGDLSAIRAKNLEMIQGSLAEQLRAWFQALGYSFESHDVQEDGYSEWVIRIPARRGYDRILVKCIEGQAELEDIKGLQLSVEKYHTDEGWLICPHRKAVSAKNSVQKDDKIFCFTFDELLDEQADFMKYFDWLKGFVKDRKIDKEYIPLSCKRGVYDQNTKEKIYDERYGQKENWIEGYIDRWLDDPCQEHISVLGEFGTGKTWFTHHYAYHIMRKYLEAKEKGLKRPRLPLVIHLRDYSKALNIESLFSEFFFHKHEVPLPNYSAFEQLNRMGKLLLIFDGFDEMADKLDKQKMINNFWELARVVVPGAKAILICRTEHFPDAKQGRELLNAELKASTANLTGNPPQFEVLELEKFDKGQVRQALSKRTDEKTVDLIMRHPELLDLASRPVMLEFILEALPDIEKGSKIDLSRIYLYAIRAKLDRDIKAERTFTSMADKLYFLCELSWEMLSTEKMSLNYRLFPERLKNLFGPMVANEKDLDHWHYDMMGNSLLIRNDDGDYSPAHRSLLEFFVAYVLLARMGMLPQDFTEPAQRQSNIDHHQEAIEYTWEAYFRREMDEEGSVQLIPPLKRFFSKDKENAFNAFGNFGEAVFRFIHEIINVEEVRADFHQLLAKALEDFKTGNRFPEKEQEVIRFILQFRALSQEWEEENNQGDTIRQFWKKHHQEEIEAAKSKNKGDIETKGKGETMILPKDKRSSQKVSYQKSSKENCLKIDMKQLPEGTFMMGDEVDKPIHRVVITKPFFIAQVPVTQALYQAIMGENPSSFKGEELPEGDELPVEHVSWLEAVDFCNELSKRVGLEPAYNIEGPKVEWIKTSLGFRLPTEAEWEYACRAGTTSRFSSGDLEEDLAAVGWYDQNSRRHTHPVGQKKPNAWGIYDMHGNVWEWVWDWLGEYPSGTARDPRGPSGGAYRMIRGGGWSIYRGRCRSAFRSYYSPDGRGDVLGFRFSRSICP